MITITIEVPNNKVMSVLKRFRKMDFITVKSDYRFKKTKLSNRQGQVLTLLMQGLGNEIAAKKLKISKRTIDSHRRDIMLKAKSENFMDLVKFAYRNGYLKL